MSRINTPSRFTPTPPYSLLQSQYSTKPFDASSILASNLSYKSPPIISNIQSPCQSPLPLVPLRPTSVPIRVPSWTPACFSPPSSQLSSPTQQKLSTPLPPKLNLTVLYPGQANLKPSRALELDITHLFDQQLLATPTKLLENLGNLNFVSNLINLGNKIYTSISLLPNTTTNQLPIVRANNYGSCGNPIRLNNLNNQASLNNLSEYGKFPNIEVYGSQRNFSNGFLENIGSNFLFGGLNSTNNSNNGNCHYNHESLPMYRQNQNIMNSILGDHDPFSSLRFQSVESTCFRTNFAGF